jgi:type IV pilus assembly protein PilO
MAINVKNIPAYGKTIILIAIFLIPTVLFYFLIYTPKSKEIKSLDASIVKLNNEIATAEVKVRRLDELRAENEKLKKRLAELKEKLPEEKEVTALLKQISDLGLTSGLAILLWKPGPRIQGPEDLYVEIPVKVSVIGGYHDLGVFFSHISRLTRIVNISKIKIKLPARRITKNVISADFTASTFSSVDEKEAGKKPKKDKKRRRRKKK